MVTLLLDIGEWRLYVLGRRTRSTVLMTGITDSASLLDVFVSLNRRALAMFNKEERSKRENQILSDFRSAWFIRKAARSNTLNHLYLTMLYNVKIELIIVALLVSVVYHSSLQTRALSDICIYCVVVMAEIHQ